MAVTRQNSARGAVEGARPPKVGIVLAFTGHYDATRVIARFLELAGVEVVTSRLTTPQIIEAGTTLASADFCIPLRIYVGHAHRLISEHPDLDCVVAPNIFSEDEITSTCSKYRDIGGVTIRSIGDTVGYLAKYAGPEWERRLTEVAGPERVARHMDKVQHLPVFVQPNVPSLARVHMRNVCFNIYADVFRLPRRVRALLFLPLPWRRRLAPWLGRLEDAFESAYRKVVEEKPNRLAALLKNTEQPRLALVGRRYLLDDPALTCDLKPWFTRRGVAVFTAQDVPYEQVREAYLRVDGYYDTHREGQAFIDWALDKVDGFISVGSFGCHPDAFQVDFLAEYARARGATAWTLRYDESAGKTGFQTRYETILTFLEQRRDRRVGQMPKVGGHPVISAASGSASLSPSCGTGCVYSSACGCPPAPALAGIPRPPEPNGPPQLSGWRVSGSPQGGADMFNPAGPKAATPLRSRGKPLIIWPYMGDVLDLLMDEVLWQAGLRDYAYAPPPISEQTLEMGNTRYTEACSPYACSTGSLKQALEGALDDLTRRAAAEGRPVEPRRILMLTARGEGPCTFGWYAIMQNKHIPVEYREALSRHGHTLEMATMGLDGVGDLIRDLSEIGNATRLRGFLRYFEAAQRGVASIPWAQRIRLKLGLLAAIRGITRPLWAKLDAAEALRARSLIVRAHELEGGATTAAYQRARDILREAHDPAAIAVALAQGLRLIDAVPRDRKIKPRVVSVGEIYIALTSYGNRGVVENMLAREGIEVVEGITLSGFLRSAMREMARRSRTKHPLVRSVLSYLRDRNVYLMMQRMRSPEAAPFLVNEVGGDGVPTVGHARHHVEDGCDGIIHTYPFKCMPEGIAKDAVKEVADLYGVRYLPVSFDKEAEIERQRTEVSTFATLLHAEVARMGGDDPVRYRRNKAAEVARRKRLGHEVTAMYHAYRHRRHTN